MFNFISVIDLVCLLAIIVSFFFLCRGWKQHISKNTALLFAGLLLLTSVRAFGNILEWSGIWNVFDAFEDYIEILEPLLWGLLFHAFLQIQTEKTLRESEENLAVTLDSIGEGVVVTDIKGKILRMNPQAEKILAMNVSSGLGQELEDLFNIVDLETQKKRSGLIAKVIGQRKMVGFAKNAVLLRPDGTELIITDSSALIYDKKGESIGVVVVFRDVTVQQSIEDQLRHSEKMKAIGQLAGGIAHDFNNLCTGINNYSELLDPRLINDVKSRKYVAHIKNCANQAAELTRMLLAFARKGKLEERAVDIHAVISEVIGILEHTLTASITIECDFTETFSYVLGDYAQLENAILNIALNARDAMPHGGTLTFATTQVVFDVDYCHTHHLDIMSGEFFKIVISDTGIGMTDDIKAHIFEPFFTTKQIDKGTGLGLASVYGTIKSHRGTIEVVSALGTGTSFVIYLPLLPKDLQR